MIISNINETKANLSQLINRALAGDEVIIARGNEPLVKLVPIAQDTSPRVGGFWANKIEFIGDWDDTEETIQEMFESSNIFPSEGQ